VSHAQEAGNVAIGAMAWERVPDEAAHPPRGGIVVETGRNEDGEQWVLVLRWRVARGQLQHVRNRLDVSDLASVNPVYKGDCLLAVRKIDQYLGQRQSHSGPPYDDAERRMDSYRSALLLAAEQAGGKA